MQKLLVNFVLSTISGNASGIFLHFLVNATALDEFEKKARHKDLVEETVEVGMMLASKAFVQLLANPFVGPLTHK